MSSRSVIIIYCANFTRGKVHIPIIFIRLTILFIGMYHKKFLPRKYYVIRTTLFIKQAYFWTGNTTLPDPQLLMWSDEATHIPTYKNGWYFRLRILSPATSLLSLTLLDFEIAKKEKEERERERISIHHASLYRSCVRSDFVRVIGSRFSPSS